MNGMTNGAAIAAGVGMPTPAGHQSELNYIWGMVEELSRQLSDNRKVTEDIISGLGRIRQRAKNQSLSNDDILAEAADDLKSQEQNLEVLVSLLSEALDKAKHGRDANGTLLGQYASAMSAMLKQFHEYKAHHVTDVCAWHRSYRSQLAEERAENMRLRHQIGDIAERAGRLNSYVRDFRARSEENDTRLRRKTTITALRQEVRFWKRMAMPEIPDDDSIWSDDSDLVDSAEKERLRHVEQRAIMEEQMEQQMAEDDAAVEAAILEETRMIEEQNRMMGLAGIDLSGGGRPPQPQPAASGGAPMQREGSFGLISGIPLPSRPASAASSTGSSGQSH